MHHRVPKSSVCLSILANGIIQQGNGFRAHVTINQEGPDDNQLHAFCPQSGGSVRSKDARGFVVGDDAEYAFACTMISLWEGARA
jgi:hypothetical protein